MRRMEVCGLFPEDPFGEGEKGAGFYFDLEVLVRLEGAASERTSMYLKVADVKGLEALPVDSLIRACRPVLVLASADEVGFKAYLDGLVGAIYAEDVQEAVSSLEGYFTMASTCGDQRLTLLSSAADSGSATPVSAMVERCAGCERPTSSIWTMTLSCTFTGARVLKSSFGCDL